MAEHAALPQVLCRRHARIRRVRTFLRYLLVWLMLLALPFQGIASAAMLSCAQGTMPHPAPAAAMDEGHCHEPAPALAAPVAQHGDAHDHDGRCSACADCCVGAVLAPAPALAPMPPDAPAVFRHAAAGHLAAVHLDLPERPPRFPLA